MNDKGLMAVALIVGAVLFVLGIWMSTVPSIGLTAMALTIPGGFLLGVGLVGVISR